MSIYITAQIIGFIGFLFYISAPHFKTQTRVMQMDTLACTIICMQWYLMEQPALYTLNILVVITSIVTLRAQNDERVRKYLFLLYPFGFASILMMAQGTFIDILALVSFCCMVISKSSLNIAEFRFFAAGAGTASMTSAMLAASIPAIIFNLLFASGHILKLRECTHKIS